MSPFDLLCILTRIPFPYPPARSAGNWINPGGGYGSEGSV